MLMRIVMLLSLLLASVAQAGQPTYQCGKLPFFTARGADGAHVDLAISDDAIRAAPAWWPGRGEPPVSLQKVVSIATAWAAANRGRFDELRIREITLASVPCSGKEVPWYYRVGFDPVLDGEQLSTNAHFIAILMDGKVVVPRRFDGGS